MGSSAVNSLAKQLLIHTKCEPLEWNIWESNKAWPKSSHRSLGGCRCLTIGISRRPCPGPRAPCLWRCLGPDPMCRKATRTTCIRECRTPPCPSPRPWPWTRTACWGLAGWTKRCPPGSSPRSQQRCLQNKVYVYRFPKFEVFQPWDFFRNVSKTTKHVD